MVEPWCFSISRKSILSHRPDAQPSPEPLAEMSEESVDDNDNDNDDDNDFELISSEFESKSESEEGASSLLTLDEHDLNDMAFGIEPRRRVVHTTRVRANELLNVNITQQY